MARQKAVAAQAKKQPAKASKPEHSTEPQAEDCEKPPVFDMLDIPAAMRKFGWPVSAKLAEKWFNSPSNIWDDKPNSIQPIDTSIVSLDWVLKFSDARGRYNKLLSGSIYNRTSTDFLKKKLKPIFEKNFQKTVNLDFDTTVYLHDLRQFHVDWQFQLADISNYETLNGLSMTDLTGALANFGIYVAIGHVEVVGERYFKYDRANKTKMYCVDPKVKITHVYVYVRDSYSFNDKPGSRMSQYLGHWNKHGMIITTGGVIGELVSGTKIHTDIGNSRKIESDVNWDYILSNPLNMPVDKRRGIVRKFKAEDVYYPIYNKSFNDWRQKHNRGGDFMIYSKPKYMKLKKPIEFTMESVCRKPEKM